MLGSSRTGGLGKVDRKRSFERSGSGSELMEPLRRLSSSSFDLSHTQISDDDNPSQDSVSKKGKHVWNSGIIPTDRPRMHDFLAAHRKNEPTRLSEAALDLFQEISGESLKNILEHYDVPEHLTTRLDAMAFLHQYGTLHGNRIEGHYGSSQDRIKMETLSPFTVNSSINFSNLAESIIFNAGSYVPKFNDRSWSASAWGEMLFFARQMGDVFENASSFDSISLQTLVLTEREVNSHSDLDPLYQHLASMMFDRVAGSRCSEEEFLAALRDMTQVIQQAVVHRRLYVPLLEWMADSGMDEGEKEALIASFSTGIANNNVNGFNEGQWRAFLTETVGIADPGDLPGTFAASNVPMDLSEYDLDTEVFLTGYAKTMWFDLAESTVAYGLNYAATVLPPADLLDLVTATSYGEFEKIWQNLALTLPEDMSGYPWSARLKLAPEDHLMSLDESSGLPKLTEAQLENREKITADLKKRLWGMAQLWNLEAARRRAGGSMNVISAMLAREEMAHIEASSEGTEDTLARQRALLLDTIVFSNVMSAPQASGKSGDNSAGKLSRLEKTGQILEQFLSSGDIPAEGMAELKAAVEAFIVKISASPFFEAAQKAWLEAAGFSADSWDAVGVQMALHVSQSLQESADFQELANSKELKEFMALLTVNFEVVLSDHYAEKASPSARKKSGDTALPESMGKMNSLSLSPFLTWLVSKAASKGFQKVLTRNTATQTTLLKTLAENQSGIRATSARFIGALRMGYEATSTIAHHPFEDVNIHSHNPAQHLDKVFGEYSDMGVISLALSKAYPGNKGTIETILLALTVLTPEEVERDYPALKPLAELLTPEIRGELEGVKSKKDRQLILKPLVEIVQTDFQEKNKAFPDIRDIAGMASFSARREALQPWYNAYAMLDQAEQLVADMSGVKRPDYGSGNIANGIDRLKGLARVWNTLESVRDFAAGMTNLLVLHGAPADESSTGLSFTDLYRRFNVLQEKNANSDPAIKKRAFTAFFNKLEWRDKTDIEAISIDISANLKEAFPTLIIADDFRETLQEALISARDENHYLTIADVTTAVLACLSTDSETGEEITALIEARWSHRVGIGKYINDLIQNLNTLADPEKLAASDVDPGQLRLLVMEECRSLILLMNVVDSHTPIPFSEDTRFNLSASGTFSGPLLRPHKGITLADIDGAPRFAAQVGNSCFVAATLVDFTCDPAVRLLLNTPLAGDDALTVQKEALRDAINTAVTALYNYQDVTQDHIEAISEQLRQPLIRDILHRQGIMVDGVAVQEDAGNFARAIMDLFNTNPPNDFFTFTRSVAPFDPAAVVPMEMGISADRQLQISVVDPATGVIQSTLSDRDYPEIILNRDLDASHTLEDMLTSQFLAFQEDDVVRCRIGANMYEFPAADATRRQFVAVPPSLNLIIQPNAFNPLLSRAFAVNDAEDNDRITVPMGDGIHTQDYVIQYAMIYRGDMTGGHYYGLVRNEDGTYTCYDGLNGEPKGLSAADARYLIEHHAVKLRLSRAD